RRQPAAAPRFGDSGSTMTHPPGENSSWNASPEPRPMSAPAVRVERTVIESPADQATTALGSTHVVASEVSSTIGQSEARITVPGPVSDTLNRPPATSAPTPPLIISMSHETEASKPSRERDEADIFSPGASS